MTYKNVLVVSISNLVKSYQRRGALRGLDLTVLEGDLHGLLGPKGAGKTTALRILLGQLQADAGQVQVLGCDPWQDASGLGSRLAAAPASAPLTPGLTLGELIDRLGQGRLDPVRRANLLERFELDPTKKVRGSSWASHRKAELVAALAAEAELYIFDEPGAELSHQAEAVFYEGLAEIHQCGRTVLLASSSPEEVEAVCDQVTLIHHGRTIATGTAADLESWSPALDEMFERL